jgi:dephospho-CoA kinase
VSRSIAFLGPQGSGKSTISSLFVEHRGYQRHGIADAIKNVAEMAYPGLTKTETLKVSRNFGDTTLTGRELLQDLGAAVRSVDTQFWLRIWRQDYFEITRHGYGVVVDDVRLDAEVRYLRIVDPLLFIVRLSASPEVRAARVGGTLIGAADITERGWTDSSADLTVDTSNLSPEDAYRVITDKMEED